MKKRFYYYRSSFSGSWTNFYNDLLALPALQRAERNNERKQEASRILAAINEYRWIKEEYEYI